MPQSPADIDTQNLTSCRTLNGREIANADTGIFWMKELAAGPVQRFDPPSTLTLLEFVRYDNKDLIQKRSSGMYHNTSSSPIM